MSNYLLDNLNLHSIIKTMDARKPAKPDTTHFTRRVNELREELRSCDPILIAARAAARYQTSEVGESEFILPVWNREFLVSFPGFVVRDRLNGQEASISIQALILYYFKTADGAPLSRHWISFSELPAGRFYNQAYQGYTGNELVRAFGDDLATFESAAASLGGIHQPAGAQTPGDCAVSFQALPRVSLLVVFWRGDEDFPASFQVLFDASASHYLPTDVCAILGGTLTRRLISTSLRARGST